MYTYFQPNYFTHNTNLVIKGTIVDIPHRTPYGISFMFKTKYGLLKINGYQQKLWLIPGQTWQLHLKLKALPYFNNPGEFNYVEYLHREGIQGMGYVVSDAENQYLGFAWRDAPIDYLRNCWYQKLLNESAGLDEKAIIIALILGDKTLLNTVDWESFERTGTSYFMVISGLHIVLFAALGALVARFLWALIPRAALWIPAQKIGLAAGLILGILYGLMAGALVPTQRAVLMLLLVGLAQLFSRSLSSLKALLIAFLVILLWNPWVIFSVAFWMSFIAVFFLIFYLSGRLGRLGRLQEWILPQWLMFWVLLPIMIYTFNQFAVIALITNLLAMPFMMLGVIPSALLGAFLIWPLPSLGSLCLKLSNFMMTQLLGILHYFAFKEWWGMWVAQISGLNMCFGLLAALIIFLPKAVAGRQLAWWMLIPVLFPITYIAEPMKITELVTSNGQVRLLQTQKHVVLEQNISNLRSARSDLRHIIEAYCIHEGIHAIDLWIINSHGTYHTLLSLMQDLPKLSIKKIASNRSFNIYDSRFIACDQANSWRWDHINFTLAQNQKNCILTFDKAL